MRNLAAYLAGDAIGLAQVDVIHRTWLFSEEYQDIAGSDLN